jgi:hypothetical protein
MSHKRNNMLLTMDEELYYMPPILNAAVPGNGGQPVRKLPPPPILRHHRPDEFALADETLSMMVADSELLPISAARHDWFPPHCGDGYNDQDENNSDRRFEEVRVSSRVEEYDDGTSSTRTSISSSSPEGGSRPATTMRRRANTHDVGTIIPSFFCPSVVARRRASANDSVATTTTTKMTTKNPSPHAVMCCEVDGTKSMGRRRRKEDLESHSRKVSSIPESHVDCDESMILGSGGFCEVRFKTARE